MSNILDLNNGINTVAAGPDNGFLSCVSGFLGAASRHSRNSEAVSNIIVAAQTYLRGGLWGHGSPGCILSYGQSQGAADQFFSLSNQAVWRRQITGLRGKVNMLSLIGCKTGAGGAGITLLRSFAEIIDFPVAAPTADVICAIYADGSHKCSIDPSGGWQTAFPGRQSIPIDGPSYNVFRSKSDIMAIRSIFLDSSRTVASSDIVSIKFNYSPPDSNKPFARVLSNRDDIEEFLQFADLTHPVTIHGVFGQIITGKVSIEYRSDSTTNQFDFDIYGDDKFVVPKTSTVYFKLDKLFHAYATGTI